VQACGRNQKRCTDADEVRTASEELIAIINGVAKLQWPDAQPVGFDGIVRAGDGREDVFIFVASCHLRLADGVPTVSVGPAGGQKSTPQTSTLEPPIATAGRDAAIAKALRILGSFEPNWAVLRKLYEVVEGDVGQPSRIEKLGWATQEEIKRFKESASDPAASGDDAVHGFSRSPLRHAPLPLGEGWVLVRTILRRWIHSKLQRPQTETDV
jgi:hypothetical protein